MQDTRTYHTKRNIIFSYLDTALTLLFQFASRSIITHVLGSQYLGLSSLFQSILHVLNMADLGFASAIVFNMYKPIAEGKTDAVCALLNYYKKIYRIIAITILIFGLSIAPFISYLINDKPPDNINIYILYILYLANTCFSYVFFAYKAALLNALQRLDLSKIAYTLSNLFQYSIQIVSIIIFKNYYLFVICMIIGTVCKNVVTAYIAKKEYPQYKCKGEIKKETRSDIISRVKGLLICNISGVTYTTFDSIILSSFIGLASVAIYNNYVTIITGITTFISLVRNAMQASVGNSVAIETREKNYGDMLLWQFLFSFIATWCVTCMISLYQPFMEMWMGRDLLLPFHDVILLCFWFFISVIQNSYFLYLSGNGLWWELRWPYIFSTVTNLVLNIILGKIIGITGIILATVISTVIFGLYWQSSIIFECYFRKTTKLFHKRQMLHLLVCISTSASAFAVNNMINTHSIWGLLIKFLICTIVSVGFQVIVFHKRQEFSKAKKILRNVVKT